eukprot:gnl/Hemi2/7444_TR2549_c0_g1_i1.p1 gnl/Hemi2/7444_TR2549_c0_g1~~gnl/Hemi2/7444_TR2549_c0_g1_i1.p1  ORF type:complete len:503 (-),score=158.69 gnl/Hemi2/7444_TR2549_c0_g1_i1:64-1572(-)
MMLAGSRALCLVLAAVAVVVCFFCSTARAAHEKTQISSAASSSSSSVELEDDDDDAVGGSVDEELAGTGDEEEEEVPRWLGGNRGMDMAQAHYAIMKTELASPVKRVAGNPYLIMIGGGMAAGKGCLIASLTEMEKPPPNADPRTQTLYKLASVLASQNYIHIDADEVKELFPEFKLLRDGLKKKGDDRWRCVAGWCQGASSKVTDLLFNDGLASKHNILWDASFSNTKWDIVERARARGYQIYMVGAIKPVEDALSGNVARAIANGRLVPLNVLVESHWGFSQAIFKKQQPFTSPNPFSEIDLERDPWYERPAWPETVDQLFLFDTSVCHRGHVTSPLMYYTTRDNFDNPYIPKAARKAGSVFQEFRALHLKTLPEVQAASRLALENTPVGGEDSEKSLMEQYDDFAAIGCDTVERATWGDPDIMNYYMAAAKEAVSAPGSKIHESAHREALTLGAKILQAYTNPLPGAHKEAVTVGASIVGGYGEYSRVWYPDSDSSDGK